jgi:uncharacterized metal-binding protein YceD (DUF177 family)
MALPRLTLHPVFVQLRDLPEEGRQYIYTRESAELLPFLQEIVGSGDFRIEIEVRPMGNVYSAKGLIETGCNEVCALCAEDIVVPVRERFDEILVIQDPLNRHDHQARVNHLSELKLDGPECTELDSETFHIGEFIRELLLLARPAKPTGRPDCETTCENYKEAIEKGWITVASNEEPAKSRPFSILEDLINK